jgi:acetolactate synthase small subunit
MIKNKKDDWWLKFNGKIISPHPELINEMFSKAGVKFYMYQSSQFMEHAKVYLKSHISKDSIDEVRNIEIFDEKSSEIQAKFLNYFDDDMDQTGTYLLRVGEPLNLPKGWSITVLEIDIEGVKAWLSLTKDGEEVRNQIMRKGERLVHFTNVAWVDEIEMIRFTMENVFIGMNNDLVKIKNIHIS